MNAQPLDWNDLRTVLAVCQEGSLSAAARKLGVNHSTVFRRIGALEDLLGVRLFERLSSGYVMTEAGEAILQAGERIENEVLSLSHKLIGKDLRLSGVLRVTAPDALAVKVLMPHMSGFTKQYPDIRLEFSIAGNYLNLGQRETDVAIRVTTSPPETMIGRKVCGLATSAYASTEYLNNHQAEAYSWLMPDDELVHLPAGKWLKRQHPEAHIAFRSNSFLALLEAVRRGQGLAPLPCFLADPDQQLQQIIKPPEDLNAELWVLSHPDLRRTARVRAFTEFLLEVLKEEIDLFEGRFKS